MTPKSGIRAEADRIRAGFEARGAELFETAILQPAGGLLNLYGEDIRARAFVTHDPLRGEMMLRPDFTVPLVETHVAAGRGAARYTYAGEVFRRQEEDDTRPTEYIQVGYEVIGGDAPEASEAEVFAAMAEALAGLDLAMTIGDFGLLDAAIDSLDTPDRRKAALRRHIWRPHRFRALLDRFSRPAPPPPPMPDRGTPHVGLRSHEEIAARIALLAEEARTQPLSGAEVGRIHRILETHAPAPEALDQLTRIAGDDAGLRSATDRIAARLDALAGQGIDPAQLVFEASYGLTALEYYSGFVFGFAARGRDDLPIVATGGRYDLLTAHLGGGRPLPAVGGVVRPAGVLALKGAAR